MKQIIQSLKTGKIEVANVAAPMIKPGFALIGSNCSLISTGTEKMLVDFGRANFINKVRQQPDKVRMHHPLRSGLIQLLFLLLHQKVDPFHHL